MKISYSPYSLTPKKRANRLSSTDPKPGVWIKGEIKDKILFADYFPHLPLGDRTVDQFLQDFKLQKNEYDQKVFDLLLKDEGFQKLKPKPFTNHQLWTGSEALVAKVVKYKLLQVNDRAFITPLEKGVKLRIDGNGIFNQQTYQEFLKDIPEKFHAQIEYFEDPLIDKDWSGLKIKSARDFIEGSPFDFYIYKPNCEFRPELEKNKIIYSAYLGSGLGSWHAYAELINGGDLSMTHGIIAQDFYENEDHFFEGSFDTQFIAKMSEVHALYQKVYDGPWKQLCSI